MNIHLSAVEARVIGCLIEKAITTPDQYPLSLNALTNACNQKSNRDPVLDLDERTVQETVDALAKKHLVLEKSGFGSRVPKYQHRFCNTGFGSLEFSPQETAILCELLLRGPQTPGELRTRASRMAEMREVSEVENGAHESRCACGRAFRRSPAARAGTARLALRTSFQRRAGGAGRRQQTIRYPRERAQGRPEAARWKRASNDLKRRSRNFGGTGRS